MLDVLRQQLWQVCKLRGQFLGIPRKFVVSRIGLKKYILFDTVVY